jgi:hypothetical protein
MENPLDYSDNSQNYTPEEKWNHNLHQQSSGFSRDN